MRNIIVLCTVISIFEFAIHDCHWVPYYWLRSEILLFSPNGESDGNCFLSRGIYIAEENPRTFDVYYPTHSRRVFQYVFLPRFPFLLRSYNIRHPQLMLSTFSDLELLYVEHHLLILSTSHPPLSVCNILLSVLVIVSSVYPVDSILHLHSLP